MGLVGLSGNFAFGMPTGRRVTTDRRVYLKLKVGVPTPADSRFDYRRGASARNPRPNLRETERARRAGLFVACSTRSDLAEPQPSMRAGHHTEPVQGRPGSEAPDRIRVGLPMASIGSTTGPPSGCWCPEPRHAWHSFLTSRMPVP